MINLQFQFKKLLLYLRFLFSGQIIVFLVLQGLAHVQGRIKVNCSEESVLVLTGVRKLLQFILSMISIKQLTTVVAEKCVHSFSHHIAYGMAALVTIV